jgi:hypothetical protein
VSTANDSSDNDDLSFVFARGWATALLRSRSKTIQSTITNISMNGKVTINAKFAIDCSAGSVIAEALITSRTYQPNTTTFTHVNGDFAIFFS